MRHRMERTRHCRSAAAGGERGENPRACHAAIPTRAGSAAADGCAPCDRRHHFALERGAERSDGVDRTAHIRSEEHTSELQSQSNLVCRLLLEKKNKTAT